MTKQYLISGAVAAALIGLAGCGGGSGSSVHTIYGKAIDGYLNGATVCLDLNSDTNCSSGEPMTTTDENGAFVLDLTDYNSSVLAGSQLLVQGGIDVDTNESFDGVLIAPFDINQSEFIITPLSTMVATKVDSNGSIENAIKEVADSLGLDPEDFTSDPIEEGNMAMMEYALEYQKGIELLAAAISADDDLSDAIAYLSRVLSPYFDGRKTTLVEALQNLDLSDAGFDEETLARIEEAKLAILSISHRLDAHGVVTEAEIRAKIRKMGRDAEKFKDKAMKKIENDDELFEDADLDDEADDDAQGNGKGKANGQDKVKEKPHKPGRPGKKDDEDAEDESSSSSSSSSSMSDEPEETETVESSESPESSEASSASASSEAFDETVDANTTN